MEGAVHQRHRDIHHRMAERPLARRRLRRLAHRRDVLLAAPRRRRSCRWNAKPSPRPRGAISSFTSANCPCPPVCRLSRACCCTARRIVSLVGHARLRRAHLQPARLAQPLDRGVEMHLALAAQHGLAGLRIMHRRCRDGSSSASFCSAPRELHVVLAVVGGDRERIDRRRQFRRVSASALPDGPSVAPVATPSSRPKATMSPAACLGRLGRLAVDEAVDAAEPLAVQRRAVPDRPRARSAHRRACRCARHAPS